MAYKLDSSPKSQQPGAIPLDVLDVEAFERKKINFYSLLYFGSSMINEQAWGARHFLALALNLISAF